MGNHANSEERLLVVFDGHCSFCSGWVRWLMRRDHRDRLRFVDFDRARELGLLLGPGAAESAADPQSLIVWRGEDLDTGKTERVLQRSEAVFAVLAELPRPWPAVAAALSVFPRALSDWVYRVVARLRHGVGRRGEACAFRPGR